MNPLKEVFALNIKNLGTFGFQLCLVCHHGYVSSSDYNQSCIDDMIFPRHLATMNCEFHHLGTIFALNVIFSFVSMMEH